MADYSLGASGDDGANYVNRICTQTTTADINDVVNLKVYGYFLNQHAVKAWIDWNNNNTIDASEKVMEGNTPGGTDPQENFLSTDITVPATATTGAMLRVRILADVNPTSTMCLIKGSNQEIATNTIINAEVLEIFGSGQIEDYGITVAQPLPLTLVDFKVSKTAEGNQLAWKTSNEVNVKTFAIKKATDNLEFGNIANIEFSAGKSNYSYIDKSFTRGHNYYKLNVIDIDGSSSFSKTISIENVGNDYFTAIENPINKEEVLLYTNLDSPTFEITSLNGSTKNVNALESSKGTYKLIFDKNLNFSEIMLLSVKSDNAPTLVHKLIRQ